MERALVVTAPTASSEQLLREAGETAAASGSELVVLAVTPESEYEERQSAIAGLGSADVVYTLEQAEQSASQRARSAAVEAFADLDVDYHTVGVVGREADQILRAAKAYDCDHLFIAGRRRSPTGKALFGDLVQHVMLNFDGPVTVLLADRDEA